MSKSNRRKNTLSKPTVVFIDYENIWMHFQQYGRDPMTLNFFPVILDKLKKDLNLNIINVIAYCNFERYNGRIQTAIQSFGVETRHSASEYKNSSDIMLAIDAALMLCKLSHIRVFVIVSSDRDMIPLLKVIKSENRLAYLFSSRLGFNNIKAKYCDYHEYLEDIFHLTPEILNVNEERNDQNNEVQDCHNETQDCQSSIENTRQVTKLLFNSNIWRKCEKDGKLVTLKGYVLVIAKIVKRSPSQIITDFEFASKLGYIDIVKDPQKGDCLRRGVNYQEILDDNVNIS